MHYSYAAGSHTDDNLESQVVTYQFLKLLGCGFSIKANAFPDDKTLEQALPTGLGIGTGFIGGARNPQHCPTW